MPSLQAVSGAVGPSARLDVVTNGLPDTLRLHDPQYRGFASDNYAGIHPEVLAAIAAANDGHQVAYGDDVYTARLQEVMAEHFGAGVEAFPVFNGTGANVIGLQSMLPRWGAVICAQTAHINTDENAAPERVAGLKLLTVPTPDGKLTPELIDREAWGWGDEHRAQPLAVSITQTTELGTAYTAAEVRAIADHVHERGMTLHMDGARVSNAAAYLRKPLREFTTDAGVDLLSFGGTKNGLIFGDVVVVLNPAACRGPDVPAQAQHGAGEQDALRLGSADRHPDRRALPAFRGPCERDGRPAAGSRRGVARRDRSPSRRSPTPSSRSCRPVSPTGCASTSGSTTGIRRPARCAGCVPSTRPKPTSTPSRPRCSRSSRPVKSLPPTALRS